MTLNEFKAWLEGYSESFIAGYPNKDEWQKIKEKFDKVVVFEPKSTPSINPYGNPWKILPSKPWHEVVNY